MSEITHMSWGGKPLWVRAPPPFFLLGVAIGLLLGIKWWHMLGLAFVAVGSFCRQSFACASISFSPFRLFLPLRWCPFLMRGLLRKSCTLGLPLLLTPSFQECGLWGGGRGASGCPCVASWGSSSPSARHFSSERGGGASGRSFGARELASVSSFHSWTGDLGVALLRLIPATRSVPVGSPSSSLHALRGDGAGGSSGGYSVLGCLSRLISARSARWWGGSVFRVPLQLRFLPGFPIFGLGSQEGALSPLLVGWLSWPVLWLTLLLRFPFSVKRSWRCGRG